METRAASTMLAATTIVTMLILTWMIQSLAEVDLEVEAEAEVDAASDVVAQRSEWAPSGMPRSQRARA